jgi:hypothetical protein
MCASLDVIAALDDHAPGPIDDLNGSIAELAPRSDGSQGAAPLRYSLPRRDHRRERRNPAI